MNEHASRDPAATEGARRAYATGADREDRRLDERLGAIRRREDAGDITTRLAADARIAAMEDHLAAVTRLRKQYLGGAE